MQREHIDPVADQFMHQHLPKVPVLAVHVVRKSVLLAAELSQRLPIVRLQNASQTGLVFGARTGLHREIKLGGLLLLRPARRLQCEALDGGRDAVAIVA